MREILIKSNNLPNKNATWEPKEILQISSLNIKLVKEGGHVTDSLHPRQISDPQNRIDIIRINF